MLAEFFRGFIKIHILHHAEAGPVYGLQMAHELARHGYSSLSPGTLYPALHALEEAGYLEAEQRLVAGRWRKYYCITTAGTGRRWRRSAPSWPSWQVRYWFYPSGMRRMRRRPGWSAQSSAYHMANTRKEE